MPELRGVGRGSVRGVVPTGTSRVITVRTAVCDYGFDTEYGLVATWFRGSLHLGTFELDDRGCVARTHFYGSGLIAIWGAFG